MSNEWSEEQINNRKLKNIIKNVPFFQSNNSSSTTTRISNNNNQIFPVQVQSNLISINQLEENITTRLDVSENIKQIRKQFQEKKQEILNSISLSPELKNMINNINNNNNNNIKIKKVIIEKSNNKKQLTAKQKKLKYAAQIPGQKTLIQFFGPTKQLKSTKIAEITKSDLEIKNQEQIEKFKDRLSEIYIVNIGQYSEYINKITTVSSFYSFYYDKIIMEKIAYFDLKKLNQIKQNLTEIIINITNQESFINNIKDLLNKSKLDSVEIVLQNIINKNQITQKIEEEINQINQQINQVKQKINTIDTNTSTLFTFYKQNLLTFKYDLSALINIKNINIPSEQRIEEIINKLIEFNDPFIIELINKRLNTSGIRDENVAKNDFFKYEFFNKIISNLVQWSNILQDLKLTTNLQISNNKKKLESELETAKNKILSNLESGEIKIKQGKIVEPSQINEISNLRQKKRLTQIFSKFTIPKFYQFFYNFYEKISKSDKNKIESDMQKNRITIPIYVKYQFINKVVNKQRDKATGANSELFKIQSLFNFLYLNRLNEQYFKKLILEANKKIKQSDYSVNYAQLLQDITNSDYIYQEFSIYNNKLDDLITNFREELYNYLDLEDYTMFNQFYIKLFNNTLLSVDYYQYLSNSDYFKLKFFQFIENYLFPDLNNNKKINQEQTINQIKAHFIVLSNNTKYLNVTNYLKFINYCCSDQVLNKSNGKKYLLNLILMILIGINYLPKIGIKLFNSYLLIQNEQIKSQSPVPSVLPLPIEIHEQGFNDKTIDESLYTNGSMLLQIEEIVNENNQFNTDSKLLELFFNNSNDIEQEEEEEDIPLSTDLSSPINDSFKQIEDNNNNNNSLLNLQSPVNIQSQSPLNIFSQENSSIPSLFNNSPSFSQENVFKFHPFF